MYVRPPNYRYQGAVRIPDNYAGNAFREPQPQSAQAPDDEPRHDAPQSNNVESVSEAFVSANEKGEQGALIDARPFRFRLGSLFGKNGSIGTEEILIIALILLLSDSDGEGFDELILFLALLFFIK